ncbi:glycoside hydrolase family 65 protein [Caldibacillus lycopersici]|uniref:Glycoside hydrolase family 65 protein n=1 Tax=Perspicuibacillus lycopersici TaxID=1325689 RepID=A0AAE3LSV4_9BACI|nr:glycosyl hydrolase family 65 protein [Perspicuibacillus lycopersici]MCU9613168.1 glycoside hydrolase family 65 protein [Perspicuibacillus lycopersici]
MVKQSASILNYEIGKKEEKNWLITETTFLPEYLGKTEAIFTLGNGYMGQRAASEEKYPNEKRGLFVSGTFNKFPGDQEVSELPNAADMLEVDIFLNGKRFQLTDGKILSYEKTLHLKNAELIRLVEWESPDGNRYQLEFRRFVSLANKHLLAQRITITPLTNSAVINIRSGINGQVTNSGTQHFKEGEKRLYHQHTLKMEQETTTSHIEFVHYCRHQFLQHNEVIQPENIIFMERRRIFMEYKHIEVLKNESITLEKISGVYTSRDIENGEAWKEETLEAFEQAGDYQTLFTEHKNAWEVEVWEKFPIVIEGNDFHQLAIRFAIYHLIGMTPAHDNRMSIGAKGLSGEGYKGHAFWDNEIFIVPFFILSQPEVARKLLEYRWLTLDGAIKKAKENNYDGAMFPWESAWLDEGEVTPVYGAADIVTGESTIIWSGFIEQHISADIAYATWQYYQYTGDDDFMNRYGYELIFSTAIFWQSRLEWNEQKQRYEINDVVGPDEYKEHVNNNAFTNHMANWNIQKAIEYYDRLVKNNPAVLQPLEEKWNLAHYRKLWEEKSAKLYLPQPNEQGIIPQDDTYLQKEIIDLTEYKNAEEVGTLFLKYNLEQVNDMQITKQADVLILLYLLEDLYSNDIKRANWDYYEPKTLHDSSLSRSTHCILAADLGEKEIAYQMFEEAIRIDLGPALKSSDAGIHAASLGGIWQSIVFGFGGVRMVDGSLRIRPNIPESWEKLSFKIFWKGSELSIVATQKDVKIRNESNKAVSLFVTENEVVIEPKLETTFSLV